MGWSLFWGWLCSWGGLEVRQEVAELPGEHAGSASLE